jgi:hypothetical protein
MTGEASKERPASRLSAGVNQPSDDRLSERSLRIEPPKLLERIIVRIEVTDTGYGIRQKEMYQTKLFSKQSQTLPTTRIVYTKERAFRSLQPDRGWQTTRRQRYWSRAGFGQADR